MVRETGRFIISEPYTPVVAAAADGSLMTVWYEWDYSMTTERQPGVLWSSQFDPRSGKWAPAVAADSGYRYAPAVASTDNGQWIVAWVGDVPGGRPGLWSKRHAGGVWEAGSQRIDTSFDEDPIEISLDALGSKVRIAWTSKRAGTDSSCIVRAAGLNTDSGKWSAPVTLSELSHLFIDNVNVRNRSDGRAVATWGTVGNPANAGFALSDASDNWQGRLLLDPDGRPGNNPAPVVLTDVGFAVTWYRFNGDSLPDVLIRRLP